MTGLVGTSVSGVFLYLIGIINLVVLVGILKVFREMRGGQYDEAAARGPAQQPRLHEPDPRRRHQGGDQARGRCTRSACSSGSGFDTATEVSLLVLAGGAAAFALPWYAILTLPILFAAGMSLLDTHRRLLHELRLRVGLLQAGPQGLLQHHDHRALGGGRPDHRHHRAAVDPGRPARHHQRAAGRDRHADLNFVGYAIVALFVLTWVVALAVWRFGRIEEKWTAALASGPAAD